MNYTHDTSKMPKRPQFPFWTQDTPAKEVERIKELYKKAMDEYYKESDAYWDKLKQNQNS